MEHSAESLKPPAYWRYRPAIPAIQEAEVEGAHIQDPPGIQCELRASLRKFSETLSQK